MSEFDIIKRHFARHHHAPGLSLGVGDDCAVIDIPDGHQLVTCVDTLVAGRHFPLDTSAHAIGYKAVAVNLSDLAAMGAKPHSIMLAISLPWADQDWLEDFAAGIYDCCQKFGVLLIGGDTTKSPTLTISVSAIGFVPHHQAITRSGAKSGQLICLSGQVGSAAFGLSHPDSRLRQDLDYPTPQVAFGLALRGFASSMIDISDGLAQDLGHILRASQCGAVLDLDKLPLADELCDLELRQAMHYALSGGDDYQLVFSIDSDKLDKFHQKHPDLTVYVIGRTTTDKQLICQYRGEPHHINLKGFDHFGT